MHWIWFLGFCNRIGSTTFFGVRNVNQAISRSPNLDLRSCNIRLIRTLGVTLFIFIRTFRLPNIIWRWYTRYNIFSSPMFQSQLCSGVPAANHFSFGYFQIDQGENWEQKSTTSTSHEFVGQTPQLPRQQTRRQVPQVPDQGLQLFRTSTGIPSNSLPHYSVSLVFICCSYIGRSSLRT